MSKIIEHSSAQADLIGAALRYCAVADWFEGHPCTWRKTVTQAKAMELFNQAEAELRRAGSRVLNKFSDRHLVLQAAGAPEGSH